MEKMTGLKNYQRVVAHRNYGTIISSDDNTATILFDKTFYQEAHTEVWNVMELQHLEFLGLFGYTLSYYKNCGLVTVNTFQPDLKAVKKFIRKEKIESDVQIYSLSDNIVHTFKRRK